MYNLFQESHICDGVVHSGTQIVIPELYGGKYKRKNLPEYRTLMLYFGKFKVQLEKIKVNLLQYVFASTRYEKRRNFLTTQ